MLFRSMPSLLGREAERKARAGDALLARPVYLQAVADYRKDQGGAVYPDANGSLRITFGHVQPYTKLNGAKQLPFTTLEQIAAKTTGREPFDSPQVLVDAIEARSEEHTSELQSLMRNSYAVFRLKNTNKANSDNNTNTYQQE